MKQTRMKGNLNFEEIDSNSVPKGISRKACKSHVAFFIESMYGGGAELSVLTIVESLLLRNYKIDLILLNFHGKRLSLIPDGVNLFVLDRNSPQTQIDEQHSIPIDEIHWMRCPPGFKELLKGIFNYFRLLKIERDLQLPPRGRWLRWIHPMSKYLKSEKPDLIVAHLTHSYYTSILGRKLSSTNIPVIWSIRNDDLALLRGKYRIYFNQLIREVDRIHAVSQGLANSVTKYLDSCDLFAEQKRVISIYNAFNTDRILSLARLTVEHEWFRPVGSEKLSDDAKVILAVGRLHDQKNFELLINVFSIVLEKIDARLVILGEGECRDKLENLVQELNIAHAVSMPGWVDNPYSFMAKADLFVSTSNYEGFPRGLTEAVICGCPVVSTDCPSGPREILEDGRWGHLTPINDRDALVTAILDSLSKDADRNALKARGKHFDIDTVIEQYENLFHEVVNEFKSNPSY